MNKAKKEVNGRVQALFYPVIIHHEMIPTEIYYETDHQEEYITIEVEKDVHE